MVEKNKSVEKQAELEKESQQGLDFFLCNEDEPKNKKQKMTSKIAYSHTKVKAMNFLTNISFRSLNKNEHANISFVLDCYSFIGQNLNPFSFRKKV